MQLGALFLSGLAAGLVAGAASCTAVQGGLLVGVAGSRDPWLVAQFLAGRFVSYTLAGALLGAIGSAVQLPPGARALLLVAAGITVIAYSVRLMRRPHCAHSRGSGRAPLMGAATILIPCGVTIGTEMVAVSTGSALSGAVVMAGFVVGTAPALALLGYLLRRVSQTRLAVLAGVVALAAGLWTVGSGLSLGGWLPSPAAPAAASTSSRLTIWATRDGYRPGIVNAPAGVPVELVFKVAEDGCTRTVTIDGRDVRLPATVRLPPQRPGSLRYVCAMGMFSGFIRFS
ncbi:sulfite exporter TauE/SafE family protein [Nonomuraea sp. NPDC050556]|uniref:sulfite exporter TauE/SafE family protein n=1 Tax=Nonomuraea sp. NPDC050556 TaxID=3364369 RepID=UPI003787A4ED